MAYEEIDEIHMSKHMSIHWAARGFREEPDDREAQTAASEVRYTHVYAHV